MFIMFQVGVVFINNVLLIFDNVPNYYYYYYSYLSTVFDDYSLQERTSRYRYFQDLTQCWAYICYYELL